MLVVKLFCGGGGDVVEVVTVCMLFMAAFSGVFCGGVCGCVASDASMPFRFAKAARAPLISGSVWNSSRLVSGCWLLLMAVLGVWGFRGLRAQGVVEVDDRLCLLFVCVPPHREADKLAWRPSHGVCPESARIGEELPLVLFGESTNRKPAVEAFAARENHQRQRGTLPEVEGYGSAKVTRAGESKLPAKSEQSGVFLFFLWVKIEFDNEVFTRPGVGVALFRRLTCHGGAKNRGHWRWHDKLPVSALQNAQPIG